MNLVKQAKLLFILLLCIPHYSHAAPEYPDQKTKVSRSKLIEKGFDFSYFTSIYQTKAGTIYYFVYDQGYLPLEGDFYALVKRDNWSTCNESPE